MKKVLILTSSLRPGSVSKKVSLMVKDYLSLQKDAAVEYLDLSQMNIPRCDGRKVNDYCGDMPKINAMFENCDALIICYPVYGQSFPGILKDVFDNTNRLYGKPVFLVQVLATDRSFLALSTLSNYLLYAHNMLVFPKFLVFRDTDINQNEIGQNLKRRMEKNLGDYLKLVSSIEGKSVLQESLSVSSWNK